MENLKDFLDGQKQQGSNILVHLCSNSEFVSSQKGVLLSKILIENKFYCNNVSNFSFTLSFYEFVLFLIEIYYCFKSEE